MPAFSERIVNPTATLQSGNKQYFALNNTAKPLEVGFGHTLVTRLRRILLFQCQVVRLLEIEIDGCITRIQAQSKGVKEDVIEIFLT